MKRAVFVISSLVFIGIVICAAAAPLIASHGPLTIPEGGSRLAPSASHWFGTDQQGRDLFARVLFGARTSLVVGIGSALLTTIVGVIVGSLAAMIGGRIDNVLMRLADAFFVFPAIVFAACLVLALGRNEWAIVFAVAFAAWPQMARVVRATVLSARHSLFVEVSRSAGLSERAIFRTHILPRLFSVVGALSVTGVAIGILAEASLSFLSIGIAEPKPSWGLMIANGRTFLFTDPHIVLFPAAAIVIAVGSLALIHETLPSK